MRPAIQTLVAQTLETFGRVDILVNSAGITRDGLTMRMSQADFDAVVDTNLKGTFLCMKAVTRPMMKQRYGRIVNLSSVVGLRGNAGQVNYAASKAGVIGMTKSLAQELAGRGITVNAVAPGFINTDMTAVLPDAARQALLSSIPCRASRNAGGCGAGGGLPGKPGGGLHHRPGPGGRWRHGHVGGERMSKRRVVITGIGAVTPLGLTAQESWEAVRQGVCGIGPITQYDPTGLKVQLAAEVKDFQPETVLDRQAAKRMGRFTQFAMVASRQAMESSGLDRAQVDLDRCGVIISSGIGGIAITEAEHERGKEKGLGSNLSLLHSHHHCQHGRRAGGH